jgi:hypothetical protein
MYVDAGEKVREGKINQMASFRQNGRGCETKSRELLIRLSAYSNPNPSSVRKRESGESPTIVASEWPHYWLSLTQENEKVVR